jgi:hypothetical protein
VITAKLYTTSRVQPALTTMSRKSIYVTVDQTQYRLDIEVTPNNGFPSFKIVSHEAVNKRKIEDTGRVFSPPQGEVAPYTNEKVL